MFIIFKLRLHDDLWARDRMVGEMASRPWNPFYQSHRSQLSQEVDFLIISFWGNNSLHRTTISFKTCDRKNCVDAAVWKLCANGKIEVLKPWLARDGDLITLITQQPGQSCRYVVRRKMTETFRLGDALSFSSPTLTELFLPPILFYYWKEWGKNKEKFKG